MVGRADSKHGIAPDIDLTAFDPLSTISRQHARIHLEDGGFYLEDLNSRNRTHLGETTLTPHKPEMLQNGAVVSFGAVKATVHLLGASDLPAAWSHA